MTKIYEGITAIVETVRVGEDELQAVRGPDGEGYVVVKRMCEVLGIDHKTQREKLQSATWAVGGLIPSTGPDGKNYECFCLHVKSVPMWLATIDANRVSEHVRQKLVVFQREAADALYAWATGSRTTATLNLRDITQLAPFALQLTQIVMDQQRWINEAKPKVEGYAELVEAQGIKCLQDCGKALKMQPNKFIELLVSQGYLFRRGPDRTLLPYQHYIDQGLFEVRNHVVGGHARMQTFVTQKGMDYFWRKFSGSQLRLA